MYGKAVLEQNACLILRDKCLFLFLIDEWYFGCTGIGSLTNEQLEQILGNIPKTWDFNRLKTIFNADTISDNLEQQLTQWSDLRQNKQPQPKLIFKDKVEENKALDIFKLRDNVIRDYRNYIESFL